MRVRAGLLGAAVAGYSTLTGGWLALGAVVAAARYWPAWFVAASGRGTSRWAHGILAAAPRSEPLGQVLADYLLSALGLAVAGVLWWAARRNRPARLLAVAVIGSAGAFNLQAHTAVTAVQAGFGVNIGWWHVLLLHGVSGVSYVLALLLFPTGRWDIAGASWSFRVPVAVSVLGASALLALSTAEVPHTVSFVGFFGLLTPLAGLLAQRYRARHGRTADDRARSRLLCTALAVALGIALLLGVVTVLLWLWQVPGLTMPDPTAHDTGWARADPSAMLFWIVRLVFAGMPIAVLVAGGHLRLGAVERRFRDGLGIAAVLAATGAVYGVIAGAFGAAGRWAAPASIAGIVAAALLFWPLRAGVERLLHRLISGAPPAPYTVLAQVAAGAAAADHDSVVAAIGRGLGADRCELTLHSATLGDRTFRWPPGIPAAAPAPAMTGWPVTFGGRQVGVLAVDEAGAAGMAGERRRLLADVLAALGPVLHDSRVSAEVEHQLATVLRRAAEIGDSRHRATAEMDSERRALERNLHDGAQHHLVAMRLGVGLVEHAVAQGDTAAARNHVRRLADQVEQTRRSLADTAAGVFPPTLAADGLGPALTAELRDSVTTLDTSGLPPGRRYPAAVESAVYFTCLEAVNNARKHAGGAEVAVTVAEEYRGVCFRVTDHGPGFDLEGGSGGRGLGNLAARAESVGGRTTVSAAPGQGTTIAGFIPL